MGKLKMVVAALVVLVPIVVVVTGRFATAPWQIAVATLGLGALGAVLTFGAMQQVATANQRLTGLIKLTREVDARVRDHGARLTRLEAASLGRIDVNYTVPPDVRRAHEELVLASRALTVPQEHFDQLLRTIAANATRTEDALDHLADQLGVRPVRETTTHSSEEVHAG